MQLLEKNKKILALVISSAIAGAAIGTVCLLNLPFFYELPGYAALKVFVLATVVFAAVAFFFINWFVSPNLPNRAALGSWLSIGIITLVLFVSFVFLAPYYWTIPRLQQIELCYASSNPGDQLHILEVHDLNNTRRYSPQSLAFQSYPITIAANSCVQGKEAALVDINQVTGDHGLGLTVDQQTDLQRLTVRINSSHKISSLGDHDGIPDTESIKVSEGKITDTTSISDPWNRKWMMLARWGSIVASSIFLAFVVFGISETITARMDEQ